MASESQPPFVARAAAPPFDIVAQGLGKKFDIYLNDRDRVFELFSTRRFHEPFWALKDISFRVPRGSAFGVIGSNGAGKSTLLRMLAGVSRPTEGRLELYDTVSSLLDLGLGFHAAFSGRQNIFLSCTLMGLSKAEIEGLLPSIVAFAELESFIDYPVKTYSSGMSLRLGFAVASHLHHQIMLIDEVLTVGDQYFQRKCVRKIEELLSQGRTIVLVSHDLHSIRSLCDSALWLRDGRPVLEGAAPEVVDAYMDAVRSREGGVRRSRTSSGVVRRPASEDPGPGFPDPAVPGGLSPISLPAEQAGEGQARDKVLPQVGAAHPPGSREALEGSGREQPLEVELSDIPAPLPQAGADDPGSAKGEVPATLPDGVPTSSAASLAPRRAETAARYQHSHLRQGAPGAPAAYRCTDPDLPLRKRISRATAIENPHELWTPEAGVEPLMEYHGELPLVTGSGEARILDVLILDAQGRPREVFVTGEPVTVAVTVSALRPVEEPIFGVAIHRNDDVYVYGPNTRFDQCLGGTYHGLYTFFLHYPQLPLLAGSYLLSVALWDKHHLKPYVWHNRLYPLSFKADREDHGLVVIPHAWGVLTHLAGAGEDLADLPLPEAYDADGEGSD